VEFAPSSLCSSARLLSPHPTDLPPAVGRQRLYRTARFTPALRTCAGATAERRWFRTSPQTTDGHLKKPAKTRQELGAAIRLEMEDICEWPTGLAISVAPHEDTWKVVIMYDMIEMIADRLRTEFDFKD
jgi:hypothetical protein